MAPDGRAATARISVTVAGIEPVTPATMTISSDLRFAMRSASASIKALRRASGDVMPLSARYCGHASVTIFKISTVFFQCSAYVLGHEVFDTRKRHVLRARYRPSAWQARRQAVLPVPASSPRSVRWRRRTWPSYGANTATSCISISVRSSGLIAGGASSAAMPVTLVSARLARSDRSPSPSEIGRMRGMTMARAPDTARNASRAARAARRVGSSSEMFGNDRTSGACRLGWEGRRAE